MKSVLVALFAIALAPPLAAAYASRSLVLPIAGRSTGADGRVFLTALWVTNPSERDGVDAALTFTPSNAALPRVSSALHLAPAETRVIDPIDSSITGVAEALGALRIDAKRDVLATARMYSRFANGSSSMALPAVPVQFAIGKGETTTLQGVAPAYGRYKIYLAEVTGGPLDISLSLVDAQGKAIAEKRLYVDHDRQITTDVATLFPQFTKGTALLRIQGVNGSGRIVAAGAAGTTLFEMSFATESRNRIGALEAVTYVLIAGVALFALLKGRRAHSPPSKDGL